MVTHHLPDIIPEMRRVVTIRDGRIHGDGPTEQALTASALGSIFGVPVEVLERDGYYHVL
jgi:iron complex transport system ATP-binding protein